MDRRGEATPGDGLAGETPRVLVFFDYACPFCYLDWPRLKQLRAEHHIELFLVPFELRPDLPSEGVPVASAGAGHSERVEEHMRRMAAEGGLTFTAPSFLPNTHAALTLGEYARDMGPGIHESVHEAIFAAYAGESRDIGAVDEVLAVAREEGLDVGDVIDAIARGRFDERLHQFRHLALAMGVTATPAALICNELLIGSRPYQVLSRALERCVVDGAAVEDAAGGPGRASGAS